MGPIKNSSWVVVSALLAAASVSGCAAESGPQQSGTSDETGERTGTAAQAISGWASGSMGTTSTSGAFDSGWNASTSTCVISGVRGDLTQGGGWTFPFGVQSEASTNRVGSNGNWIITGHGGSWSGNTPANNPVEVNTVCVPFPRSVFVDNWTAKGPDEGPPHKIGDLAPNRRCFLTGLIAGNGYYSQWADAINIQRIDPGQTDSTHPTTGFYLQSNLQETSEPDTFASAACIDFPSIAGDTTGAFGGTTNQMTPTNTGTWMCGLTGIFGAYNVDLFSDGAFLTAPTQQNGTWTMTVSNNKFATAECIN